MCGIYGIIRVGQAPLGDDERSAWARVTAALAALSTARGTDSTGIARVAAGGGQPLVLKDAVPAWELIAMPEWHATATPDADTFSVIGHTRYATHGAVTRANAHPFVFADEAGAVTVGVHNGIVSNAALLRGRDSKVYAVDSANLIAAMADMGMDAWRKVLRRAEGTLAIAVARTGAGQAPSVTLTRRGNPLWVTIVPECGGALAFASTKEILTGAVDASRCTAAQPRELDEGVLYRWCADGAATSSRWNGHDARPPKAARRAARAAGKVDHGAVIRAGGGKDYTQCTACLEWHPCEDLRWHGGQRLCRSDYFAATGWSRRNGDKRC